MIEEAKKLLEAWERQTLATRAFLIVLAALVISTLTLEWQQWLSR